VGANAEIRQATRNWMQYFRLENLKKIAFLLGSDVYRILRKLVVKK
jgi:hypothetical protein